VAEAVPGRLVDPAAVVAAVAAVKNRIRELSAGREVHLIAVTKGFGADAIRAAVAAGCSMVGENYAQELQRKMVELGAESAKPEVHFIGQLQTNKVRLLASLVDVWQTVDRPSVVAEIARRAPGATIFVQVNTTDESAKGGCAPVDTAALVDQARVAGLNVSGLMTVGPTSGDPQLTADAFGELRVLADRLGLHACSMGMSGDYETAIAHGATHVRIGSALFGARPTTARSDRIT
jgi:pyridoxal phosphate enzyme (YggS family)